jgi:hypothetical protein
MKQFRCLECGYKGGVDTMAQHYQKCKVKVIEVINGVIPRPKECSLCQKPITEKDKNYFGLCDPCGSIPESVLFQDH